MRFTQKDLARRAGVTQATVSLALSSHVSISPDTRERIQKLAREMDYHPDPYLSGLSAYRKKVGTPTFQATLAWVSNFPDSAAWRRSHVFLGYYEGACARALELGYRVEEHVLSTKGMTPERAANILIARNISGLLLAPQPHSGLRLNFTFDRFSAVTFGYTLVDPQLHIVTLQMFRSMEVAFRKLIALGYRRPGLAIPSESDYRADRNWSAAFWSEQRGLAARDRIPLLLTETVARENFLRWFKRYKPDVIIGMNPAIHEWLTGAGFDVPGDVGLALLTTPDGGKLYSGIWENPQVIGAKAVEFLIDLIHRSECGVPKVPLCLLVAGTWVDGKTVRSQK